MSKAPDVLLSIRMLLKLHEQLLEEIRADYGLSQMEIKIISFLHNNPGRDTIGDIAELRMLPKGNVSQSVEALVQKALLVRAPDQSDRRKFHLSLTKKAAPLAAEIEKKQAEFGMYIYDGLTQKEIEHFYKIMQRIMENAGKRLERK